MVWFRVGCCERCWGVGSRGERGSLGLDSIASIIPKMQMMRGSGGDPTDHTIGGRGGGKNTRTDVERSKIIFRTTYQNIKYRFIIQLLNKVNTLFIFINLI